MVARALLQQPVPSSSPLPAPLSADSNDSSTGTYVGIALGSAAGAVLLVGLFVLLVRRRGPATCLWGIVSIAGIPTLRMASSYHCHCHCHRATLSLQLLTH